MREIKKIIIHCSDSDYPVHDNVETIRTWHMIRGFNDVGYHYVITKSYGVAVGRLEEEIGAHCKGHNDDSIGICLTGKHEFSESQFRDAYGLIMDLMDEYGLDENDVYPHNYFNKGKTCPNFSLEKIWNTEV